MKSNRFPEERFININNCQLSIAYCPLIIVYDWQNEKIPALLPSGCFLIADNR